MSSPAPFTIDRDQSGALRARSRFPLGFNRRSLEVDTYRSGVSGALVTHARCVQVSECGRFASHAIGCGARGDFAARLAAARVRATARAIEGQHAAALATIGDTIAAALAHYGRDPADPCARSFTIGDGSPVSLADIVADNPHDYEALTWAQSAAVGDTFGGGAAPLVRRIA